MQASVCDEQVRQILKQSQDDVMATPFLREQIKEIQEANEAILHETYRTHDAAGEQRKFIRPCRPYQTQMTTYESVPNR